MDRLNSLILVCALTLCCSCGGDKDPGVDNSGGDSKPAGSRGGGLGQFAGAHARAVWVGQQKSGKIDQHAAGNNLKLMGLDSMDSRGERAILDKVGSYARPLFTPDGGRVVFSNKGITKSENGIRSYNPRCFVVNFDGTGLVELGEGYAEAIWRDPSSGELWVFVSTEFQDDERVVMEGKRLERFRLEAPEQRELLWDKTPVGGDSFRVSRDGQKMVGQFPWPESGVVDLKTGDFKRIGNGCWTSLAPDNSGISWVFDGPHRNVSIYDSSGRILNSIAMNTHPDLKGQRVYHPRWTNHPHFAVVSGPYINDKKKGADRIEIYLGRFAADMSKVEQWYQVSENDRADLYADVWIEGGDEASLTIREREPVEVHAEHWPPESGQLFFAWKNNRENIETGGRIIRVRAEGAARYGKRFDLAPGKGLFRADGIDAKLINGMKWLIVDAIITPDKHDGTVMEFGNYRLSQKGSEFRVNIRSGGGERSIRFGKPVSGQPLYLRLQFDQEGMEAVINGKVQEIWTSPLDASSNWKDAGIVFGGGWDGRLEQVAFYGSVSDEVSVPQLAGLYGIKAVSGEDRLKIRGKLLEVTPRPAIDELGAYTRALVYHLYEIDDVLAGEFNAKRMVVAHWSLLDRKPTEEVPSRVGEVYEMEVEPLGKNPQLKSERTFDDTSDLDAAIYFDISTPLIQESENP
ncbi:MAG: hypothetical protein GY899_07420 [Verrucomicrobiaceae bacterium]|nr:hypothetical protein [Verrucomicrobiaceae bacterium]